MPELNTKIMRAIEDMVCEYRDNLPNGWRCLVEFQCSAAYEAPYYQLDIESNMGGGAFAPIKMEMLKLCPDLCATGTANLDTIISGLTTTRLTTDDETKNKLLFHYINHLRSLNDVSSITDSIWDELKQFGFTHWYGGIRIPYDLLVTVHNKDEQSVQNTKGEMRISFSGAKEWQDTFFCFELFRVIQVVWNELWACDQIWYNLRELSKDPALKFWITAKGIQETLSSLR